MTILLHNASNAGLFDRCGVAFGWALDIFSALGGTATTNVASATSAVTRENNLATDLTNTAPLPVAINGLDNLTSSFRSAQNGFFSGIGSLCNTIITQMAQADTALPSISLSNALALLVSQMTTGSQSVQSSTIAFGAQTAVGSPVGNPIFVLSNYRGDGLLSQLIYPETLTFKVSKDSTNGGTAGNEAVSVVGQTSYTAFDYRWPGGSGLTGGNINLVDGSKSNATGNNLSNSDFATVSNTNLPDNWTASVGVVGTNIFNGGSGNAYTTGGGSLQFTGDVGSTLTAVIQKFNTANSTGLGTGGTPYVLTPGAVLIFNGWLKCSATPAAGVVEIALVDSTGAVLNDAQGVANSFTKSLTAVSTTYVNFNGVFRTPANLTSANTPFAIRIRLSTAIDSTKSVYFGRCSLAAPASALYVGGPYCVGFSGNAKVVNNVSPDQWTVAITNTYGKFQREFQRYFTTLGLTYNGLPLQLPYSGSPTVPDTYIA